MGDVVFVGGRGFSVAPSQQAAFIREEKARQRRSGGGGGGRVAPKPPTVSIKGNTVFIDGKGYSVAPEQQAAFIREKTGGVGSSAQTSIAQAEKRAAEIRQTREAERQAQIEKQRLQPAEKPTGVVSAAEQRTGLAGLQQRISRQRSLITTEGFRKREDSTFGKFKRQTTGFGLGLAATGVGTLQFGESILTKPITTLKSIPSGIKETGQFVASGKFARSLREEPGFFTGRATGEIAVVKGLGAAPRLARVGITKVSPKGRSIITQPSKTGIGTEKVLKNIEGAGVQKEIAIVPPKTPPTSKLAKLKGIKEPSLRGGFGYTQKEQVAILKKDFAPIVSGQAGFKAFDKPLTRELFGTPGYGGRGFVRTSRLGTERGTFSQLLGGEAKISLRRPKPSILVFPKTKGFGRKPTPGTELETTVKPGLIPIKTGKPAATVIGGERVPIFTVELKKAPPTVRSAFQKAIEGRKLTSQEKTLLKKRTGFKPSELSKPLKPTITTERLAPTLAPIIRGIPRRLPTRTRTPRYKSPSPLGPTISTIPKTLPKITSPAKPTVTLGKTGRVTPTIPTVKKTTPTAKVPPVLRPPITRPLIRPRTDFIRRPRTTTIKKSRRFATPFRIPSLVALGRGIKAPTKATGEFSALTIRPILTGVKKRAKKKKKK